MEKKWLVVINPNAGSGKGGKDWPLIHRLLEEKGLQFSYRFSEYHGHLISMIRDCIKEGYRNFIAVGGDGTINEVVNGIFTQDEAPTSDIVLGAITIGTGNDWGRMFNIPHNYTRAIDVIANCNTLLQDAGTVEYQQGNITNTRYFINIAGLGFDALVAKKTNILKQKGRGNALSYLITLAQGLFRYRHNKSQISVDNARHTINIDLFSMNVGICQYNGGGMKQVPNAIPDDGLFDLTIISKMKKISVIMHLRKLYKGTHLKLPFVSTMRASSVSIDSPSRIWLEADGESLGHTPMKFEIIPRSIRVIIGNH
ncbi:MAG: diacylglycerol/lipid kinase family protein [Bacteroidota bacterium]